MSTPMKRDLAIAEIVRHRTNEIIVAAYHAAFDLLRVQPNPLNFLSFGSMGLASSHGLGLALGRPDRRVLVFDGDGSLLMNLGTLVTIAEAAPPNLAHFVFENGTYEANGAVPTPGRGVVSFAGFARAAGFRNVHEFSDLAVLKAGIGAVLGAPGPTFVTLHVVPGDPSPVDFDLIHGAAVRKAFKEALKNS